MELQTIGIVGQLIAEITVTGCIGTRNHGYALRKKWHFEFFLQIENALSLQLIDNLQTLASHVTHCEFRIDIGHNP